MQQSSPKSRDFSNLLRNLTKSTSNGFPEGLGDGFWASWGRLLGHFSDQRPPRRKKRRKLTWRTLAPGSKLGLKIFTFPEKAAPDMKKWVPRQALEKAVYLEGVKTLKMMTLTALLLVF